MEKLYQNGKIRSRVEYQSKRGHKFKLKGYFNIGGKLYSNRTKKENQVKYIIMI